MSQKRKVRVNTAKPVSVLDVAAFILGKQPKKEPLTAWKLQKLVYYCQAWSLVWDEKPHKGLFYVKAMAKGRPDHLSPNQKDTIEHVLQAYGDKTAQWLSDLTHMEEPWIQARKGLRPGERGAAEIDLSTMIEYYSGVDVEGQPIIDLA